MLVGGSMIKALPSQTTAIEAVVSGDKDAQTEQQLRQPLFQIQNLKKWKVMNDNAELSSALGVKLNST